MKDLFTFTSLVRAIDEKWGHTYEPFVHEVTAECSEMGFAKTEFKRSLYIPSLKTPC
jgi:hypothetical protein